MKKFIMILLVLFASSFGDTITDKISRLNQVEEKLLAIEERKSEHKPNQIAALKKEIQELESDLKLEKENAGSIIYSSKNMQIDNFELLNFLIKDWSESSYQIIGHLKCISDIYAEWVKVYFYLYKNDVLVADDYTYIDFESYGYSGVLPYYETYFVTYFDKVDFDRIDIMLQYDIESGQDEILCDQMLQHVSYELTPTYSIYNWEGTVSNIANYSVEFPKIHATIFRSDSLIEADYTYLDTECQGDNSIIIDYVIDSPIDAQEVTLYNCTQDDQSLSGWYLGDKDSPYSYQIPYGRVIGAESYESFDNNELNFTIDQEDEIIYLFDESKNLVDTWSEDENENILYPLTSCCYDSYLDLPDAHDDINFRLNYSLHSLTGDGNIPPNYPAFTRYSYEIAAGEFPFQLFLIDANKDDIQVQIDWGDGSRTGWLGPFASRSVATVPHTFVEEGEYRITARTQDSRGTESQWCDSVRVRVDNAVPVELSAFSANALRGTVILRWRTESETHNLGFAVQRSGDRQTWQQIAFMSGHGTTVEPHDYTYEDEPGNGTVYYRLRQIDQDGSTHDSKILTVTVQHPESFELSISPNPFNASTRIHYQVPESGTVRIDVFDSRGRQVAQLEEAFQAPDSYSITWDAAQVGSGTYFIRLNQSSQSLVQKCVVLK